MTSKMPYKVHISEISVLGYLKRVAMLKVLIITMLEMITLSLPKNSDHGRVASMKSNICMKKRTRNFIFGVMESGHNLDLAIYSNY